MSALPEERRRVLHIEPQSAEALVDFRVKKKRGVHHLDPF